MMEKEMKTVMEILEDIRDDVDYETCEDLVDGKVLNSFEVLQVVSELNDAFEIMIPASEVVAENFNSAKAIYTLVKSLL